MSLLVLSFSACCLLNFICTTFLEDQPPCPTPRSNHAESSRVLDSRLQSLPQYFFGAVLGDQQLVEAGVRAGQSFVVFSILDDVKFKRFKPIHGGAITSGWEGQPLSAIVIGPLHEDNLPEPGHHFRGGSKSVCINAMVTKLLKVELSLSTNQRFYFFVIEQALNRAHI